MKKVLILILALALIFSMTACAVDNLTNYMPQWAINWLSNDEPVDDEPVDDEPVDDEPVDDEPVDDEPAPPDNEIYLIPITYDNNYFGYRTGLRATESKSHYDMFDGQAIIYGVPHSYKVFYTDGTTKITNYLNFCKNDNPLYVDHIDYIEIIDADIADYNNPQLLQWVNIHEDLYIYNDFYFNNDKMQVYYGNGYGQNYISYYFVLLDTFDGDIYFNIGPKQVIFRCNID